MPKDGSAMLLVGKGRWGEERVVVLLLGRYGGPSHYWQGAQASQPCVCSCDLSYTSWSGFCNGKIIKCGGGRG